MIIPAPSMIPFILKNEPFCIYVFFKPDVNKLIYINCFILNENLEFPIHITQIIVILGTKYTN